MSLCMPATKFNYNIWIIKLEGIILKDSMHCFGISKLPKFLFIASRVLVPLSIFCCISILAWFYCKKKIGLGKSNNSKTKLDGEIDATERCQKLNESVKCSESMVLISSNERTKSPRKQPNTSVQKFTTYKIWI